MRRVIVCVLALVLVAGACSSDKPAPPDSEASTPPTITETTSSSTTSSPDAPPDLNAARVKLTTIAKGLDQPLALAVRPGDHAFYVAEQPGRVVAIVNGTVQSPAVLDITKTISTGGERGLLGIAFSSDGAHLYIDYTDEAGNTHLQDVPMRAGTRVADLARRRDVLTVDQPYPNHNGGELTVDRAGLLYVGLGDGGSAGDPHGNGQNLGTLLGKILRIDPRRNGSAAYSVPSDNPFVGRAGTRPEIWAWGLRNPWRFSFDRATNDMWIGDVGQNAYEEIDFARAGGKGVNWGWSAREGFHRFKGDRPSGARDPIFETNHTDGYCAIVGGYVYRGGAIPALAGTYLFSDNCKGNVLALVQRDGKVVAERDLGVETTGVASFGEDAAGNLYVLSLGGTVFRVDAA